MIDADTFYMVATFVLALALMFVYARMQDYKTAARLGQHQTILSLGYDEDGGAECRINNEAVGARLSDVLTLLGTGVVHVVVIASSVDRQPRDFEDDLRNALLHVNGTAREAADGYLAGDVSLGAP